MNLWTMEQNMQVRHTFILFLSIAGIYNFMYSGTSDNRLPIMETSTMQTRTRGPESLL